MSTLTGGLRKVCIYNPVNGDRVILRSISAETELPVEWINSDTPTGNAQGQKDINYTIHFFDADSAIRTQMETWEEADTPVCLVMLFTNAVAFELTPQSISGFIDSLATNANDGVSPFHFNYKLINHDPFSYKGVNFLWAAMKRNNSGETQFNRTANYRPELLDGASPGQWRRDNATQTAVGIGNGEFVVPFPFEGETIFADIKEDTTVDDFFVRVLNFAKTQISQQVVSVGTIHSQTIPSGGFWVTIQYEAAGEFREPSMRLQPLGFVAE